MDPMRGAHISPPEPCERTPNHTAHTTLLRQRPPPVSRSVVLSLSQQAVQHFPPCARRSKPFQHSAHDETPPRRATHRLLSAITRSRDPLFRTFLKGRASWRIRLNLRDALSMHGKTVLQVGPVGPAGAPGFRVGSDVPRSSARDSGWSGTL
eukprot:366285-Chlamydomonas_euryale.AAC.2